MMRIKAQLSTVPLAATIGFSLGVTPAHAESRSAGRDCVSEWYYDLQAIQRLGYRCAEARVNYVSESGVLWKIQNYQMRYTVSAGMSFGARNNENPFQVSSGFRSGTSQWLSADSGDVGSWFTRTGFPTAFTYKGQTVVKISAYPDVPKVADPKLSLSTSTW